MCKDSEIFSFFSNVLATSMGVWLWLFLYFKKLLGFLVKILAKLLAEKARCIIFWPLLFTMLYIFGFVCQFLRKSPANLFRSNF